jgi:hypothetical protein
MGKERLEHLGHLHLEYRQHQEYQTAVERHLTQEARSNNQTGLQNAQAYSHLEAAPLK